MKVTFTEQQSCIVFGVSTIEFAVLSKNNLLQFSLNFCFSNIPGCVPSHSISSVCAIGLFERPLLRPCVLAVGGFWPTSEEEITPWGNIAEPNGPLSPAEISETKWLLNIFKMLQSEEKRKINIEIRQSYNKHSSGQSIHGFFFSSGTTRGLDWKKKKIFSMKLSTSWLDSIHKGMRRGCDAHRWWFFSFSTSSH